LLTESGISYAALSTMPPLPVCVRMRYGQYQFSGPYPKPPNFWHLKPSRGAVKYGDNHPSRSRAICEYTYIHTYNFVHSILRQSATQQLLTCPPRLHNTATLPWEITFRNDNSVNQIYTSPVCKPKRSSFSHNLLGLSITEGIHNSLFFHRHKPQVSNSVFKFLNCLTAFSRIGSAKMSY